MPTDPALDPSTPSANYEMMISSWSKIETLLGGTPAMRAAGTARMPKHQNEHTDAYTERLNTASLLNVTKLTLDMWTGKPFGDPVTVSEDVNPRLKTWLPNIDLQGNTMSVFARNWFREGVAKAFAHVLVDAPTKGADVASLLDDERTGARPFLNFIPPENLIAMETRLVDGQEVVTHARIFERETVRVGFAEETIDRIREFNRILPEESMLNLAGMEVMRDLVLDGRLSQEDMMQQQFFEIGVWVTVWRKKPKQDQRDDDEWEIETGPTKLDDRMDEIPIVTYYVDKDATLLGKPPLEDLADLNINWWQSNSDQNSILTVSRFALLALSGGDEEEAIMEIGPRRLLFTPDPRGKFYYVEHNGLAIQAGRDQLKDLEDAMAHYGAEFLRRRPGRETATARALQSAEATSPLEDAAMRFNAAMAQVKALLSKWGNLDDTGTITVAQDFEPIGLADSGLEFLDKARERGDLSKKDHFEEMRLRGVLRQEFDLVANDTALKAEPPPPTDTTTKQLGLSDVT